MDSNSTRRPEPPFMVMLLPLTFLLLTATDDPAPPSAIDVVSALENVMADAIAKAEDSIVAIARDKGENGDVTLAVRGKLPPRTVRREQPQDIPPMLPGGQRGFIFRIPQDPEPEKEYVSFDYGSGVVIGENGEILTAFHVVKGASRLRVKAAGRQEFDAEIIAADPRSDLAVIVPREDELPRVKLKPIKLGDASKLRKGSFLIALGNPFNAARDGRASASWGILANYARRIDQTDKETSRKYLRHFPTLLQMDAKLNLGMSGGAVVNIRGELVGLTTNAANVGGFDAQAGYAVPLDMLGRRIVSALVQGKEAEYGYLGIYLSEDGSNRVSAAQSGSPAADAGLVVNDQIISVGGLKVTDGDTLVTAVNSFSPGIPLIIDIVRGNQPLKKTVVLGKLPIEGLEIIATNRAKPWHGLRVDHASLVIPRNEFGGGFNGLPGGGVGIVEVVPGSPADEAGLKVRSILYSIAGKRLRSPKDFDDAIKELKEGDVELVVDGDRTLTMKIPPSEK